MLNVKSDDSGVCVVKNGSVLSLATARITNIATCTKAILTPLLILKRASALSECIVHYNAAYLTHDGLELDSDLTA